MSVQLGSADLNGKFEKYVRKDLCDERTHNMNKRISFNNKITLAVFGGQIVLVGLIITVLKMIAELTVQ